MFAGGVATQEHDWEINAPGPVTSFGEDANGELYVLAHTGQVVKIVRQ